MSKIGIFFDNLNTNLEHPKSFWSLVMNISILAGIVLASIGILYGIILFSQRVPLVIVLISVTIVMIFFISGLLWLSRDD